jgi:hypothetical protein
MANARNVENYVWKQRKFYWVIFYRSACGINTPVHGLAPQSKQICNMHLQMFTSRASSYVCRSLHPQKGKKTLLMWRGCSAPWQFENAFISLKQWRVLPSSGIWRQVVRLKSTDVTEEHRLRLQDRIQFATCFHAGVLLGFFDPEDVDDMFLWNVGWISTD